MKGRAKALLFYFVIKKDLTIGQKGGLQYRQEVRKNQNKGVNTLKIAKIFATGISGDIRSEFTVYNVKDVKTIKLTDQCKCYQFLGCEKGKAQAIYLHKTSDVFFRLIPDIEDIITIIEQEYSELSKAYQEKEKIYSSKKRNKGTPLVFTVI